MIFKDNEMIFHKKTTLEDSQERMMTYSHCSVVEFVNFSWTWRMFALVISYGGIYTMVNYYNTQ